MSVNVKSVVVSGGLLVTLVLSLGLAFTSLGMLYSNTYGGAYCFFYVSESQARNHSLSNYNIPTCKLSLASSAIPTICLSILTLIEIISVVFQLPIKKLPAKIFQVVVLMASMLFLFITMIVVSSGWAKTCATIRRLKETSHSSYLYLTCTGYRFDEYPPHGGEIIAVSVCAGIGFVLCGFTLCFYFVKYFCYQQPKSPQNDQSSNIQQQEYALKY